MPAGTFPVPPDVRTDSAFTIVKGVAEMIRTPAVLADPTANVDQGEWLAFDASGSAVKATAAALAAAPLQGARASWTLYRQGDSSNGQADAMGTGQVDLLSGTYQAKTQLYDTTATWTPGSPIVVIFDAVNGRGILYPLDVTAPPTVKQLAATVGQVINVANGVLHYEAK